MSTVQAIAGILLVFGLLALFYWMAYRFSGGRGFPGRASKIEIIESRGIGDKRMLLLVRVGSETLLVGSTTHQISLLSQVDSDRTEGASAATDSVPYPDAAEPSSELEAGGTEPERIDVPVGRMPQLLPRPSFRAFLEMFR